MTHLLSEYWYEPSEGSDSEFVPIENAYVTSDDSFEVVDSGNADESSGIFGLQGGVGIGPFRISAGVGAGR